ncbi:hypothetical protein ACVWWP_006246 [Bradyrhizobium sp. LM3.6]
MSWIGTGSMTSTSPESSAATRVASEAIGVKMISFRLPFHLAPVIGVGLEHGLHAGLMALDDEGTGTVLVQRGVARRGRGHRGRLDGLVLLSPLLVHDVPDVPRRMQDGIGRGQDEIDRVVVDFDDLDVRRQAGLHVRVFVSDTIGGEQHVVGGEGVAVVEFYALSQMEAPPGRLRSFPALRQRRNDLEVLVARGEALIDVTEMGVGGGLVQRVGIKRLQVALVGIAQRLARRWRHRQRKHTGERRRKQSSTD